MSSSATLLTKGTHFRSDASQQPTGKQDQIRTITIFTVARHAHSLGRTSVDVAWRAFRKMCCPVSGKAFTTKNAMVAIFQLSDDRFVIVGASAVAGFQSANPGACNVYYNDERLKPFYKQKIQAAKNLVACVGY